MLQEEVDLKRGLIESIECGDMLSEEIGISIEELTAGLAENLQEIEHITKTMYQKDADYGGPASSSRSNNYGGSASSSRANNYDGPTTDADYDGPTTDDNYDSSSQIKERYDRSCRDESSLYDNINRFVDDLELNNLVQDLLKESKGAEFNQDVFITYRIVFGFINYYGNNLLDAKFDEDKFIYTHRNYANYCLRFDNEGPGEGTSKGKMAALLKFFQIRFDAPNLEWEDLAFGNKSSIEILNKDVYIRSHLMTQLVMLPSYTKYSYKMDTVKIGDEYVSSTEIFCGESLVYNNLKMNRSLFKIYSQVMAAFVVLNRLKYEFKAKWSNFDFDGQLPVVSKAFTENGV